MKFTEGDIVVPINNYYTVTNKANNYVGRVTKVLDTTGYIEVTCISGNMRLGGTHDVYSEHFRLQNIKNKELSYEIY